MGSLTLPPIDWGSLAPYIVVFWTPAIALLTAYVAHLWDQRSKREEFRREKRYDRKFAAYQQVLGTLTKTRDLVEFRQTVNNGQVLRELEEEANQVPTTIPEPDRTSLIEQTMTAHFEFIVRVRSGALDYPSFHSLPLPRSWPLNPALLFVKRLTDMLYHALAHSIHDYEKAMNVIRILGCSDQLDQSIECLWETLGDAAQRLQMGKAIPGDEWLSICSKLDAMTGELAIVIQEDLEAATEGREPRTISLEPEEDRPPQSEQV